MSISRKQFEAFLTDSAIVKVDKFRGNSFDYFVGWRYHYRSKQYGMTCTDENGVRFWILADSVVGYGGNDTQVWAHYSNEITLLYSRV